MKALFLYLIVLFTPLFALEGLAIQLPTAPAQGESLKVKVDIPAGWHLTADDPLDEFLIPLQAQLTIQGLTLGAAIYSESVVKEFPKLDMKAAWFEDSLTILFPIVSVQSEFTAESYINFKLSYQACDDKICLSPTDTLVSQGKSEYEVVDSPGNVAGKSYLLMLLMAFIGGLILNLMPCVLPVLGLKIFSLIRQSGESKFKLIRLGVSYTLGVVVSFWALALAVVLAQNAGSAAGWGFQFTHPGFVLFMIVVVFLFALNLLGAFEITLSTRALTVMDAKSNGEGLLKAFLNGAFMTLISTPCSAPFLGTGVGYALTQPPVHLFVFFTLAGLGLALPFLLISFFPQFANKLPRPGDWMLRLKEFMGFTLLATMLWLLFVLTRQVGIENSFWIMIWLLLISLLTWTWKHWGEGFEVDFKRKIWVVLGILILAGSTYWLFVEPALESDDSIQEFSMEQVRSLNQQGKWVFVDYTADWCISCKVNEANVLSQPSIQSYFAAPQLEFVVADYTRGNPVISEQLRLYKRAGVPMYILYGPAGQVKIFPELLTESLLMNDFESRGFQRVNIE